MEVRRTGESRERVGAPGDDKADSAAPSREWDSIVGAFLQRGIIERCFYWIPITAGHPALVSFHILRTPLVSGRYLLSVATGLHRTMRALQALKDS